MESFGGSIFFVYICNMKLKLKDRVTLPFNETGTIVKIVTEKLDWFPYKVRLRKVNPVFGNKTNQILEFKESQLKLEEPIELGVIMCPRGFGKSGFLKNESI